MKAAAAVKNKAKKKKEHRSLNFGTLPQDTELFGTGGTQVQQQDAVERGAVAILGWSYSLSHDLLQCW